VRALVYVLLVGVISGLVGWINQSYLKEQTNWFMTMRPYMQKQVRPYVLTPEAERALQPGASFRECAKDCPEMIVLPAGEFTMGSPASDVARRVMRHQAAAAQATTPPGVFKSQWSESHSSTVAAWRRSARASRSIAATVLALAIFDFSVVPLRGMRRNSAPPEVTHRNQVRE
jgi:hypothetical protein